MLGNQDRRHWYKMNSKSLWCIELIFPHNSRVIECCNPTIVHQASEPRWLFPIWHSLVKFQLWSLWCPWKKEKMLRVSSSFINITCSCSPHYWCFWSKGSQCAGFFACQWWILIQCVGFATEILSDAVHKYLDIYPQVHCLHGNNHCKVGHFQWSKGRLMKINDILECVINSVLILFITSFHWVSAPTQIVQPSTITIEWQGGELDVSDHLTDWIAYDWYIAS